MTATNDQPLWTPSAERIAASGMDQFRRFAAARIGRISPDSSALYDWSVSDPGDFWSGVWDFCGVIGEKGEALFAPAPRMRDARFFPGARLNFAENLLRQTGASDALVFRSEDKIAYRWSWDTLRTTVSVIQQALRSAGIRPGDRVAGLLPNIPEAIAAMLAVTSIGAVWTSASPDFGAKGVLDRFGQLAPRLLITCDGYWYNGKPVLMAEKLTQIAAELPGVETIVVVPVLGLGDDLTRAIPRSVGLLEWCGTRKPKSLEFVQLPFDHPLFILFSSGTTGIPKCIVHRAGGVLLQLLKEHRLHADTRPGDRIFYYTTLGWMMWNWLAAGLACGATLLLFDGSPFAPSPAALFDYADAEGMTLFGTSAKYIDALKKENLRPAASHDLAALRTMCSTGSPLSVEGFRYVYDAIKPDLHLASISGGTDIVSCFVLGDPTRPVWAGEIQGPGLGMAVHVFDDNGHPVVGQKGELVCTEPFPVMPLCFWNDPGDARYTAAYFERFPGVWCHGDFAEVTEHGGFVIHGRSDATLNPGGVRIGTAEIYSQVETLPEILESICVAQEWDNDVRVVLFVRLAPSQELSDALVARIKATIRAGASPRHVPAKVVAVPDIPRTKSGKIVELAVREVIHGRPVRNAEALANPEALAHFANLPALQS
jgi:acetoacetyl-CoA synthetase